MSGNVYAIERSFEYWYSRAQASRRALKDREAAWLYGQALKKRAEDLDARLELAETLTELGCYTRSREICLSVLAMLPTSGRAYYDLALNACEEGDALTAAQAAQLSLCCEPRGAYACRAQDLTYFIPVRERPLRGARAETLLRFAANLRARGLEKAARMLLKKAARLPSGGMAETALADILSRRGQNARALKWALRAVKKAQSAFFPRLVVCALMGEEKDARLPMAVALAAKYAKTPLEIMQLCDAAASYGAPAQAEKALRRALREKPDSEDYLLRLGNLLRAARDEDGAKECFARCLELAPMDVRAMRAPQDEPGAFAANALAQAQAASPWERELALYSCLPFLTKQETARAAEKYFIAGDENALRACLCAGSDMEVCALCAAALRVLCPEKPYLLNARGILRLSPMPEPTGRREDDGLRALKHRLALRLQGRVSQKAIGRIVEPVWKKLPLACRAHCRADRDGVWPDAFTIHILKRAGLDAPRAKKKPYHKRVRRAVRLLNTISGVRA